MSGKIHIDLPIIVEGRYDKNTLSQILDATVVATDGFSVFNSREKQRLILKLAERGGVILLTDSDGGGIQIRKFLLGILPKEKVFNLYIPKIPGKEKRKSAPGKAGLLGVEGMKREVIEKIFAPFASPEGVSQKAHINDAEMITLVDFYELGLTGADSSSMRRDVLAERYGLPSGMTVKALISALNIISSRSELMSLAEKLLQSEEDGPL